MRQKVDIQEFHECTGQHSHSYPQILVPLQQTMSIQVGEEEYNVTCQELCFVPAGMVHQCSYRGRLLAINLSLVDDKDAALLSRPIIVSMRGQVIQLVELIQAELKQNPESKSVEYLYSYLYSKLLENCAAPSIRYISEHYDLPITVNQLAEMERYNVTYYNDWFKQQTGCSPNLYLRRIRIDRAKELLAETGFTVMEIAVMVGSMELTSSLSLGLTEYQGDNASIYPSSTNIKEGKLPQAPMEIALPEDVLQYLGFDGNIGDKISLSLEKSLRHNIADSYSYTAKFVLTGILESNYLGYVSGTVTGIIGEGTAMQLLPKSHIYYNVDIRTADKRAFQSVVDDINGKLQIHELDTSYNIVYLNAMGISYTADSEDANDTGFSFMAVAGILVAVLILLAAGLVIYNILKISVSKRMKGYGTLRAIGGEKGQLCRL